jgi:putative phosphoribosyl transferase
MSCFLDRADAGRQLAARLKQYAGRGDVVVLALPRGGVPVGFEVAQALGAPLDVFVVRKLGVPGHEELAMGAVASGGTRVLNRDVIDQLGIPARVVEHATERARIEVERSEQTYRGERPMVDVKGRVAIIVDDGLATGSSMRAAAAALRAGGPARLVVAVPVAAPQTCAELRQWVDDLVCVLRPDPFYAVGLWYADFSQTTDADVWRIMERHHQQQEEAAMYGTITELVPDRGFGFITDQDGREYFFQRTALMGIDYEDLTAGERVEFLPRPPEPGDEHGEHPRAVSIRIAEQEVPALDHERLSRQETA